MCMLAFPCILSHRSNTTYIAYIHWTRYKAPILGVHYPKLQPWFTMTLPCGSDASGWRKWTRDLTLACSGCAIAPSPHLIVRSSTSQLLDNNFTSTLRTCCYWCLLNLLTLLEYSMPCLYKCIACTCWTAPESFIKIIYSQSTSLGWEVIAS